MKVEKEKNPVVVTWFINKGYGLYIPLNLIDTIGGAYLGYTFKERHISPLFEQCPLTG